MNIYNTIWIVKDNWKINKSGYISPFINDLYAIGIPYDYQIVV